MMDCLIPTMTRTRGISSTLALSVIVVVVIIAAAGWAAYAAYPMSKTVTSTVTQTNTSSGATGTQSASTTATQTFLQPTNSDASFTVAGFTQSVQFSDWFVGLQSGIFKQYVPNAKFVSLAGAQIPQALASGQAQMSIDDPTALIPAIATGLPATFVASLTVSISPWVIVVAGNSTIQSLQQLHGQNFGVTTVGSTLNYLTQYELSKQLGWKLNTDYKVVGLGSVPSIYAALETGSIQATLQSVATVYNQLASGTFRSVYNFSLPYPAVGLVATNSFIEQHPDAVLATVEAFLAAGAMWNTNGTLATSVLESQFKLSPEGAAYAYGKTLFSSDGFISVSGFQAAVDLLKNGGALNATVSVPNIISSKFVPITY